MKNGTPEDVMRTADAIARRALILSQIVAVAYGSPRGDAIAWLKREQLLPDLSPREQDFLTTDEPTREDVIALTWCVERLVPLLWVIRKTEKMCPLTSQCDTYRLRDTMVWPPAPAQPFIESAELRSEDEIRTEYEKVYNAHWKVRDAQLFHRPIPDGLDAGVAYERHYAFNWVIGYGGQEWDDVSTDT